MHRYTVLLLSAMLLWGCAHTVLVPVPPRVDLAGYRTIGIVDFSANAEPALGARAARLMEEHVQAAQPGTRVVELGSRDWVLGSVGSPQLDAAALKKIGAKYSVDAIFVGDLAYAEPRTDVRVIDVAKLEGAVKTELRADISSRLLETASGASVWSRSAWAKRQIGNVSVSERGVSGGMRDPNPREAMLPGLVYQLTYDFRPGTVRKRVD